jgi:hypothetical protein
MAWSGPLFTHFKKITMKSKLFYGLLTLLISFSAYANTNKTYREVCNRRMMNPIQILTEWRNANPIEKKE